MSILPEYKKLLKDTLSYLKTSQAAFIESSDIFFNTLLPAKKQLLAIVEKIKPSINIQTEITPTIEKAHIPITITSQKQDPIVIQPIEQKKEPSSMIVTKVVNIENKPDMMEDNLSDIQDSFKKLQYDIALITKPLDDSLAKKKLEKYKYKNIAAQITILAYKEDETLYKFLNQISLAINTYFYPSKVVSAYLIEKENNWDSFLDNNIALIISSDYTIFELPHLRSHFKENPTKGEKFLKNIPLFLLPDLYIYIKEPSLKTSLFQALKQKITNE